MLARKRRVRARFRRPVVPMLWRGAVACPRPAMYAGATRMHWFWRGMIAVAAGSVSIACLTLAGLLARRFLPAQSPPVVIALATLAIVVSQAVGLAAYSALTRAYGPKGLGTETICRRCGYILRGITEPRCPECGEPI